MKKHAGTETVIDPDSLLLSLMQERFDDYYDVLDWCEKKAIPFTKKFDPWA